MALRDGDPVVSALVQESEVLPIAQLMAAELKADEMVITRAAQSRAPKEGLGGAALDYAVWRLASSFGHAGAVLAE